MDTELFAFSIQFILAKFGRVCHTRPRYFQHISAAFWPRWLGKRACVCRILAAVTRLPRLSQHIYGQSVPRKQADIAALMLRWRGHGAAVSAALRGTGAAVNMHRILTGILMVSWLLLFSSVGNILMVSWLLVSSSVGNILMVSWLL